MGLPRPEVLFNNLILEDAKKARSLVLKMIGKLTEEERKSIEEQILDELKAIRKILEQRMSSPS